MRRAALALAAILLLAAAPAPSQTIPGGAARALAMAFQFAAGRSPLAAGVLDGITVHIGDLPRCYRIRFDVDADATQTTTVRLAKAGDAGGAGCPDDKAPEFVLPGPQAEAIARIVRAWSNGALDGAPPNGMIDQGSFTIVVGKTPAESTSPPPGTIAVIINPIPALAGACPPGWAYDPAAGSVLKFSPKC